MGPTRPRAALGRAPGPALVVTPAVLLLVVWLLVVVVVALLPLRPLVVL